MKVEHRKHFTILLKQKRKRLLLCFSIFLAVIFFFLSFSVVNLSTASWDLFVSQLLQEDQNDILDVIMKGFSWLGNVSVAAAMVLLFAAIFLIFSYKYEALLILSCLLTGIVSYSLKLLINRPRPTQDFVRIIEETHYQSFPSGHVLFYTVFFGSLILIAVQSKSLPTAAKTVITLSCLIIVFLCAVSRVYLGAHWFTDVLGGFILGILFLMITGYCYLKAKKKRHL